MGVCRRLRHTFNFENMRFVFKFTLSPIKFCKKIYFQRMLVFPFFTPTYVPLDEQIPFHRKQF